jgi:hypothetical protein
MREKTDDVQEQSGITQHLKLLGDFGFDVLAGPMPFIGVLQPIRPARRAVGASGLRLMMAEGGETKLGTSRRCFTKLYVLRCVPK